MPRHIMAFAVRPRADRLLAAVMREYAYNTQGETRYRRKITNYLANLPASAQCCRKH